LISLGKITSNTSSASNLVKTVGLEVWEYYNGRGMWVTLDDLTDLHQAKKKTVGPAGNDVIVPVVDVTDANAKKAWH